MKTIRLHEDSILVRTLQMAAVALIAGFLMYYAVTRILINDLENSLVRFAEQGATTIDTYLSGRLSEVRSIAANSIINNTELPVGKRLEELRKQLSLDMYRRLSIADLHGNSITTENDELFVGDREYFKSAAKGIPYVSDPIKSRVDNAMVIVFAVPIQEDGKVTGVLYATYDADVLSLMTDKIKLNDSGHTFVINNRGVKIAHENRQLVYGLDNDFENFARNPELKKLIRLEENMIAGQKGTGDYYYDGESRYMGYCPIGGTGWSIAVTAPKNVVFSKLNIVFILLFILILASSLIIAFILSRSKLLKLDLLKQQMNTLRIADFTNLIALTISSDGNILTTNRYADEVLLYFNKFHKDEVQNIYEILSAQDSEKLKNTIDNCRQQNSSACLELALGCGGSKTTHIYCSTVSDKENNETLELIGIDITERVEQETKLQDSFEELNAVYGELAATEDKIRQQAFTDSLTGLPNRAALHDKIGKILGGADKPEKCALMYLDLDNFKNINDSFGHSLGDLLLVETGRRLREAFTADEIIARFEGDEFVIFVRDFRGIKDLKSKADTAMNTFSEPFTVMNNNFHISASCGVSIYPDHAGCIEEMLRSSDVAMYQAKRNVKGKYLIFERSMNDDFAGRINMENGLRRALDENEFLLYYQPLIDLNTNRISGFEALLRWRDSERGMIPPLKFISVAEETGLIIQIGKWVLQTACEFIKNLNEKTGGSFSISVNISVVQLMQSDFVSMVKDVLKQTGLAPSLLELELTESKLVEAVEMNLKKLNELRKVGVKLSVDDFGTGFSSLSYLKQLPIDTLKIDKSFVDDIPENDNSMIESIIHIGHQRNLIVIAEGVEKQEQSEFLTRYKCDMVQGYLYSRPVPGEDVGRLL